MNNVMDTGISYCLR